MVGGEPTHSIQLIKNFLFIIDTSTNFKTPMIPCLVDFIQRVCKSILEATPLARLAIAVLNQSKCYLETRFTQDIEELLSVFQLDRVNQQGSISISTALLLLYQLSEGLDGLSSLLVNFSPITFDSAQCIDEQAGVRTNMLELIGLLRRRHVVLHSVSVQSDIFVLQHISRELWGFHATVASLGHFDFAHMAQINRQCSVMGTRGKYIPAALAQQVQREQICNCCGELRCDLWECKSCGGLNCVLGECCVCARQLLTFEAVRKSQLALVQEARELLERATGAVQECSGCQHAGGGEMWRCPECGATYCAECRGFLGRELRFCVGCCAGRK